MIKSETITYEVGEHTFEGYLAYDVAQTAPRPGIIIAHAWKGHDPFVRQKAEEIASLGYVGFAADVYGQGVLAQDNNEAAALMAPLFADRSELQSRINAAYDVVCKHEKIDTNKIAAMGYCFGGLTVLELLRSGTNIRGAVSFHGLLGDQMGDIIAKHPDNPSSLEGSMLFFHGHDDPFVSQEDILKVQTELTNAGVDWQMHIYGNTSHAFTNPQANDTDLGLIYNPIAEKRAWKSMQNFFEEIFNRRSL